MAGFDPRISVVGSDCSTNCAPANHCPNRSPCLKLFLLMITLGEWLMATTSLSLFSNADRVMGEHWKEFFTIFYFYWDSIWNINFSKEALPKLFRYWTFIFMNGGRTKDNKQMILYWPISGHFIPQNKCRSELPEADVIYTDGQHM